MQLLIKAYVLTYAKLPVIYSYVQNKTLEVDPEPTYNTHCKRHIIKKKRRSNMKYDVTITGLGPMALEFLSPGMEMQFVILFNEDAPAELAELAILHTKGELTEAPVPGDTMKIGGKTYKITAVGDEAVHTLRELGHCTLAFSASEEAYRPGCIMLDGEIITAEDVANGAVVQIF